LHNAGRCGDGFGGTADYLKRGVRGLSWTIDQAEGGMVRATLFSPEREKPLSLPL
jgi:hypothetical protein